MVKVDSNEIKSPIRSCDSVLKGAKSQSPLASVSIVALCYIQVRICNFDCL